MGVSKKRLCAWGAPRCRLVIQPCPGQYLHQGLVGGTACSYHVGPEVHLGQLDGKVAHAASAALDQHARARPGHAPRLQSLLRKDTDFELARRSVWLPRLCPCMATAVTRVPALDDAHARLWHASRLQSLLRMGTDHEHGWVFSSWRSRPYPCPAAAMTGLPVLSTRHRPSHCHMQVLAWAGSMVQRACAWLGHVTGLQSLCRRRRHEARLSFISAVNILQAGSHIMKRLDIRIGQTATLPVEAGLGHVSATGLDQQACEM